MLAVVCWLWKPWEGSRHPRHYGKKHVNALSRMVREHMSIPYEFICITDQDIQIEGDTFPLWDFPKVKKGFNCFCRLKVFDPEIGRQLGDRILSIDLDVVIEKDLAPLIDESKDFQGIRGDASLINGSFWTLKTGTNAHVWDEFDPSPKGSLKKIRKSDHHGSDQAWMSLCMPKAPVWTGNDDGVWTFKRLRRVKPTPDNRRITVFPGGTKPWSNTEANYAFQVLHKEYMRYL